MQNNTYISRSRAIGFFVACCGAILIGTEAVVAQLCYAGGFNIITILTVRYCIAVFIFLAAALVNKVPLIVPREYRKQVLILGLLSVGGIVCLYMSLARLPAALAILFFYAYPSFTAIISRVFFRNKLSKVVIASLLFSACGLVLLYWSSASGIVISGVIFSLLAALDNAIKLNVAEKILPKMNLITYNFDIAVIVAVSYIVSIPIIGGFSLSVQPSAWIYALFLSIVVTAAATYLLTKAIRMIGAVHVSIVYLLEPPTAAITAYFAFGDVLSGWQLLGGCFVLMAVALPQIAYMHNMKKVRQQVEKTKEETDNSVL